MLDVSSEEKRMSGEWIEAATLADLDGRDRKLVRHHEKRIALFRTPKGVFAVDNRCPHEGYALLQGDVKDGLACHCGATHGAIDVVHASAVPAMGPKVRTPGHNVSRSLRASSAKFQARMTASSTDRREMVSGSVHNRADEVAE